MRLTWHGFLIGCQSIQVYHHHPVSTDRWSKTSESGRCSYISGSYSVCSLFFHFEGGRPLHNVQSVVFLNPLESPTARFTSPALGSPWKSCCTSSRFQDVAPIMSLGSLFHCCFSGSSNVPTSLLVHSSFLGSWCNIVLALAPTPCHSCTAGHPSAGGGQLLPGPTLALGPFRRLPAAPFS
jgi:hypothetical protein